MSDYGLFSPVCVMRDYKSKRSSTWQRNGGNCDWTVIPAAGGKEVLVEEAGSGCIRHFYWTFVNPDNMATGKEINVRNNIFRGLVLRAYWNGSDEPSIEVPLGDFFGVCNGHYRSIKSLPFVLNSGSKGLSEHETWGFNCYLPMPFTKGAYIEIENQGEFDSRIWYHVDYECYDSPTALNENTGLLHAVWNRENPTRSLKFPGGYNLSGSENYIILDTEGSGQFAGYFLTVVNRNPAWWGEGDDMIFIDGEDFPPSIHGTGTEEIFGGGACPDEEYTGPYTGFHIIENLHGYRWYGTNGAYRFHIADPIRFYQSIRVTLEHGHDNDLENEYVSTAFWYQSSVNRNIKRLPKLNERLIDFPTLY